MTEIWMKLLICKNISLKMEEIRKFKNNKYWTIKKLN